MPSRRRFTGKFASARIKKIIQLDEEIGKIAATVPSVVCKSQLYYLLARALELLIEELMTNAYKLTVNRSSKTIPPSYLKNVIEENKSFSFLLPLVENIQDNKCPDRVTERRSSDSSSSSVDIKVVKSRGRPKANSVNNKNFSPVAKRKKTDSDDEVDNEYN